MGKKKPFIPRGQGTTYALLHANTALHDEDAERVLVPLGGEQAEEFAAELEAEEARRAASSSSGASSSSSAASSSSSTNPSEWRYDRKDYEYGDIGLPEDGYDYLKHIRAPGTGVFLPALNLVDQLAPQKKKNAGAASSSKAKSLSELELGLQSLPEDVAEVLEGACDVDDELEDDFVALAGGFASDDEHHPDFMNRKIRGPAGFLPFEMTSTGIRFYNEGEYDDDDDDDDGNYDYDYDYDDDDGPPPLEPIRKSAKPVPRLSRTDRAELEEDFAAVLEEYGEEEIGELDENVHVNRKRTEADNYEDAERFDAVGAKQYSWVPEGFEIVEQKPMGSKKIEEGIDILQLPNDTAQKTLELAARESDDEDPGPMIEVVVSASAKFDCESILSTYTDTDHHPQVIDAPNLRIRLSHKTGIPVGIMKQHRQAHQKPAPTEEKSSSEGDDAESDDDDEEDTAVSVNAGAARPQGETAEEKRLRKQQVKEMRRGRRKQKQVLKQAFKSEEQRQVKNALVTSKGRSVIKL